MTNYRVLFVGQNRGDSSFDVLMSGQSKFVYEFFNVPIGMISRIEKQYHVPQEAAKKSANNFASQPNYIEIITKDGRQFKYTFGLAEHEDCKEAARVLINAAFLDQDGKVSYAKMPRGFPFHHRIEVMEANWMNYQDGWSLFTDMANEVQRMGINLATSTVFKEVDNRSFNIC